MGETYTTCATLCTCADSCCNMCCLSTDVCDLTETYCKNGATCIKERASPCICAEYYSGTRCENRAGELYPSDVSSLHPRITADLK